MAAQAYHKATTGLLFIGFSDDLLSDAGKLWPLVKEVATKAGLFDI